MALAPLATMLTFSLRFVVVGYRSTFVHIGLFLELVEVASRALCPSCCALVTCDMKYVSSFLPLESKSFSGTRNDQGHQFEKNLLIDERWR
jgi:putative flippase GtrA